MSTQSYDNAPEATPQAPPNEAYAPQASAAVDILPVVTGRRSRQPDTESVAPPVGVDPAWGAPAPVAPAWGPATEVTPADGAEPAPVAGVERVTARPQAIDAAPGHTPLVYAGAIPPPVAVPVFPSGGMPVSEPVALDPAAPDVGTDGTTPSAKRFLGMQLRRPRRGDAALDGTEVEQGPQAPVAAWPTDVGLPVVATAEPATPAPWGPPALPALPVADGSSGDVPQDGFVDLLPPVDAPPAEARPLDEGPVDSVPAEAAPADAAPVDVTPIEAAPVEAAPVEAAPVESAPVEAAPVESAPVEPVDAAPVESAPVEPVDAAPVETAPVEPPTTPMPLPAADEELRSLRTSFEASEARRTAAEQRADNAVAYAQQLQAQLTQVTADLEGRLLAAETRTRTVANEAQDWQIRHREAQAQIAELAMSLAGAEERLAAVRDERDDLMTQLEQATDPSRDEVAAELDA